MTYEWLLFYVFWALTSLTVIFLDDFEGFFGALDFMSHCLTNDTGKGKQQLTDTAEYIMP